MFNKIKRYLNDCIKYKSRKKPGEQWDSVDNDHLVDEELMWSDTVGSEPPMLITNSEAYIPSAYNDSFTMYNMPQPQIGFSTIPRLEQEYDSYISVVLDGSLVSIRLDRDRDEMEISIDEHTLEYFIEPHKIIIKKRSEEEYDPIRNIAAYTTTT